MRAEWRMFRWWIADKIVKVGLCAAPDGRAKSRLLQYLAAFTDEVIAETTGGTESG